MPEISTIPTTSRAPLFSTRKIVHMSMLIFAFLLPYLNWMQAAGCALLALMFNVVILPRLGADLGKGSAATPESTDSSLAPLSVAKTGSSVWTGIVIYPVSVLALILLYRHDLHIVAATWAIMALGDGAAGVAGSALRGPALPWNREKSWSGFLGLYFGRDCGRVRAHPMGGPQSGSRNRPENLRGCGIGRRDGGVCPDRP